jgi:cytochrome c556
MQHRKYNLVIKLDRRFAELFGAKGMRKSQGNEMTRPVHRRIALHRSDVAICLAVAGMVGFVPIALGQDQSAATGKDAIVARKTVMDTLSDRMDTIEAMIASGKKIDLDAAHMEADTISVFLMAFPHLFPGSTNEWKPNVDKDPATDTFASPDVWSKFADFYRQTAAASKAAYDASRASDETALKAAIGQLRTDCNACHAAYLKPD